MEFWLVNHPSRHENSELKVYEHFKALGERSNNLQNNLFGPTVYKTLEFCWWLSLTLLQFTNSNF